MERKESLLKILNELKIFYSDIIRLIIKYEPLVIQGKYVHEFNCPAHNLERITSDDQFLYINCSGEKSEIYCYSLNGYQLTNILKYKVYAMEIVNNKELFLMDDSKFFILDIQTNYKIIQNWDLPMENDSRLVFI